MKRVMICLMVLILAGCDDGLFIDRSSIRSDLALQLWDDRTWIEQRDQAEHVYLYCEVSEGYRCFNTRSASVLAWDRETPNSEVLNFDHRLDRELGNAIITEIGVRVVVDSQRSGVIVWCQRPIDDPDAITCSIDRGSGWENLPVR